MGQHMQRHRFMCWGMLGGQLLTWSNQIKSVVHFLDAQVLRQYMHEFGAVLTQDRFGDEHIYMANRGVVCQKACSTSTWRSGNAEWCAAAATTGAVTATTFCYYLLLLLLLSLLVNWDVAALPQAADSPSSTTAELQRLLVMQQPHLTAPQQGENAIDSADPNKLVRYHALDCH